MLIQNYELSQAGIGCAVRVGPPAGGPATLWPHTPLGRILVLFAYEREPIMPVEIAVDPPRPSAIMRFALGAHIEKDPGE